MGLGGRVFKRNEQVLNLLRDCLDWNLPAHSTCLQPKKEDCRESRARSEIPPPLYTPCINGIFIGKIYAIIFNET